MKHRTKKLISRIIIFFIIAFMLFGILQVLFPIKYVSLIREYAKEFDVDPSLIAAVICAESRFRPQVTSPKGAKGLMQLVDKTANWGAEELGIENFSADMLYEPTINIRLGTWYLAKLTKQFSNQNTMLAAYNAGSGNVSNWLNNRIYSANGISLDNIPFTETANYVKRVQMNYRVYRIVFSQR